MKILIVEDDFTSRKVMQGILSALGSCDTAVDGKEAIEAVKMARDEGAPYDLICMDIMMPNVDGHEALTRIRDMEKEDNIQASQEVKVIMTTALGDPKNVLKALNREGATAYFVKPVSKEGLLGEIRKMGLIK